VPRRPLSDVVKAPGDRDVPELSRPEVWLLAAGLFCLPALVEVLFGGTSHALLPYDVLLLLLALLQLPGLRRSRSVAGPIPVLLLVLLVLTVISALLHPSGQGLLACLRLVEIAALVHALTRAAVHGQPRIPLVAFVGTALIQALLGFTEAVTRTQLTPFRLDDRTNLLPFGDQVGVDGTFLHPYLLAGMIAVCVALLAGHRCSWRVDVLAAAVAVPLGLTYSRMSVLALVLIGAVAVAWLRAQPTLRVRTLTAIALGAGIPAVVTVSGWVLRAHESGIGQGAGPSLDEASSGRITFIREAWGLIRSHPWSGVGPGRYLDALRAQHPLETFAFPVHNVPLLVTAEIGVLGGVAMLALLVAAGWTALRSGPRTTAIFVAYLPFVLLDWPYGQPQAVMVMGLWLALVNALGPRERQERAAPAGQDRVGSTRRSRAAQAPA
jgi:O-antigen ligase